MPTLPKPTDLNLIPVFLAVYETGSVQKAADRLGQTASATSHALGRLRQSCRDELFIRLGQGLEPTAIARRIYPDLRRALESVRLSMDEARAFDPMTAARRFQLAIPHPLGPLWALGLDARLAAVAPQVSLRYDTRTLALDPDERLADGVVDLLLDWVPIRLDRFVNRELFGERLVVVARNGHPRIGGGAPSLAALRAEGFVTCHFRRRYGPGRSLAQEVTSQGITARLMVSEFLEIPFVVAESDMLGLVPASMARQAERRFGLRTLPLPFALKPVPIWLVWHETRRKDPGHAWLRAEVAETIGQLVHPALVVPPGAEAPGGVLAESPGPAAPEPPPAAGDAPPVR